MPSFDRDQSDTPLGHEDVAILLLEMQPHIVAASQTVVAADLRRATAVVMGIAKSLGIPVLASAVPFAGRPPVLIEELSDVAAMARSVVSPFADRSIAAAIRQSDRRTLVIGGVSSEIAILRSVCDARRDSYAVYVLVDLCGGLSARTEATAFAQMTAAGATVTNISSFFTGMISDMGSAEGAAVMSGVAQLWSWGNAG